MSGRSFSARLAWARAWRDQLIDSSVRVARANEVSWLAVRFLKLQGFVLANGRHVARLSINVDDDPAGGILRRSQLWSAADEGRSDLVAALALPANRHVLLTLATVPHDSKVEWTIREVGRENAIDLLVMVQRSGGGGRILLMIDCSTTPSSPARLREQMVQAVRSSLSAAAKISLTDQPTWTKLILLSAWRNDVPIPDETKPLPALQRKPDVLESIPEPQVWGFVPFVHGERSHEVSIALGRWEEFQAAPWTSLPRQALPVPWQRQPSIPLQAYGPGAQVELDQSGRRVRVSLRLRSSSHRASMKRRQHGNIHNMRVRNLRRACYAGQVDVGSGRFVGETIEDGIPRLHWDWAEGLSLNAEKARSAVIETLHALAGLSASGEEETPDAAAKQDPAAKPEPAAEPDTGSNAQPAS